MTTISCFKTKDLFVCGFESGNLRLFDLPTLKIALEMTFEERKVEQIEVSNSDEQILVVYEEKVNLLNQDYEIIKSFDLSSKSLPKVGFNQKSNLFFLVHNLSTLEIYSCDTLQQKFQFLSQEIIQNAIFSNNKEDLFVITSKNRLKKYKMIPSGIKLYREYVNLHSN